MISTKTHRLRSDDWELVDAGPTYGNARRGLSVLAREKETGYRRAYVVYADTGKEWDGNTISPFDLIPIEKVEW